MTPALVLERWFSGCDPTQAPPDAVSALWFRSTHEQDAAILADFGPAMAAAREGALDGWSATAEGRLALILLLDQLPRNAFRGTGMAFSGDARALRHALEAIATGHDRQLPPLHRGFIYLPLEHAEDLDLQDRCVALMAAAAAEAPPGLREFTALWSRFAVAHREIIARFGRFPHRNEALGRASTPDELAWLAGGGENFGQTTRRGSSSPTPA